MKLYRGTCKKQDPRGFNMNGPGWSETDPGVEWCVDGQGAITLYLDAPSQYAPHRKTFVLFSMPLCPHAGRAHPFSLIKRMQKSSQSDPSPRVRIFSFLRQLPDGILAKTCPATDGNPSRLRRPGRSRCYRDQLLTAYAFFA